MFRLLVLGDHQLSLPFVVNGGVEHVSQDLELSQWMAYELAQDYPLEEALTSLMNKMEECHLESFSFYTQIMITPGYEFKVIEGLITNFHQPKSTLLLLIAALVGDDWKKIYSFAMDNGFRFLSYGDSSFLVKENGTEACRVQRS